MKKIKFDLFDTYITAINNSTGTHMFRNIYAFVDGRKKDVAEGGVLSCAFFVSSILTTFGLAKKMHATVQGTLIDMEKSGWKKINKPKIGAILLWGPWEKSTHEHIGFYVAKNKAISNDTATKVPKRHDWQYGGKRPVLGIYWHPTLEN